MMEIPQWYFIPFWEIPSTSNTLIKKHKVMLYEPSPNCFVLFLCYGGISSENLYRKAPNSYFLPLIFFTVLPYLGMHEAIHFVDGLNLRNESNPSCDIISVRKRENKLTCGYLRQCRCTLPPHSRNLNLHRKKPS